MIPNTVCTHFAIRYSPFTDTFPLREPFTTSWEANLLQRMEMLVGQGKSLCLCGEPGSGKSVLLRSLMDRLDSKNFRSVFIPYSGQKPTALLREICEHLAIDTTGRGSLLRRVHKALSRTHEAPYTVLVLDEAHALPREALLELFSLTQESTHRTASASIILSGHPVLEKTLALDIHSAIRTRLACRFTMKPLEPEEVGGFIGYRLKAAGAPTDLFDKEAVTLLGLDSKGNRRVLMNLCGNCMDQAVLRQERLITAELAQEVSDSA